MSVIYILSDQGKLGKRGEALVLHHIDGNVTTIFPYKTDHLVAMGNISISGDAIRLITKNRLPMTFLSKNGKFNAKLTFGENKNVFLRQRQYSILNNPAESLAMARAIVLGKIRNQLCFMQRIGRTRKLSDEESDRVNASIAQIKNYQAGAETTDDIEKLRGLEGMAARTYFGVFTLNLIPEWAEFKNRSRNPPESNVNAVLSFLYTLLMYRVESALESQGLDVYCGNLHALAYGKTALVYDLVEEFRTPVADAICCSLFNLGVLNKEDFRTEDFPEEGCTGVLLSKEGLNKVIAAFEEKMETGISYQKIIYAQAEHYRRVMAGEDAEYIPYQQK